jgi:hypothetical protein
VFLWSLNKLLCYIPVAQVAAKYLVTNEEGAADKENNLHVRIVSVNFMRELINGGDRRR